MHNCKGKRPPVNESVNKKELKRTRTKKISEQPQDSSRSADTPDDLETDGKKGTGKGKRTQGQRGRGKSSGNVPMSILNYLDLHTHAFNSSNATAIW